MLKHNTFKPTPIFDRNRPERTEVSMVNETVGYGSCVSPAILIVRTLFMTVSTDEGDVCSCGSFGE